LKKLLLTWTILRLIWESRGYGMKEIPGRLEQLMAYLAKRAVLGIGIGFTVFVTCHRPGSQTASGPPACSTPVAPAPPPASCEAERQHRLLLTETTHDLSRAVAGTLPVPQMQEQATVTLPSRGL